MIYIAPSILAADFGRLADEVRRVADAGADFIHCDVMDGHFVPNISFGAIVVEAAKRNVSIPVNAHLMIDDPNRYVDDFIRAGADIINVHCESQGAPLEAIDKIKQAGRTAGVTLNPETPFERADEFFPLVDYVLCMTVHPGFGGQDFIPEALPLIERVKKEVDPRYLAVDGGVNPETIRAAAAAGANFIVAGTAVFRAEDPAPAIRELRRAAEGDG